MYFFSQIRYELQREKRITKHNSTIYIYIYVKIRKKNETTIENYYEINDSQEK